MLPKKSKTFLTCCFFLSFISSQAFAGAWTQKKGGYFLKLYSNYLFTKNEFNHDSKNVPIFNERIAFKDASFRDINVTFYGEYGLEDWLTLVGSLRFKSLQAEWQSYLVPPTEDNEGIPAGPRSKPGTTGLADLTLGAKTKLFSAPFVLSLQSGVKIPLGYTQRPSNDGAPLGTGDVDLETQLLLGKSLYPLPIYITGGFGFRQRGGALHDEWIYSFEAGYTSGKFLFKVNFDGIRNTSTPPDIPGFPVETGGNGGGNDFPQIPNVGDLHVNKLSPSIIYNVKNNVSIQLEALHVITGTNTTNGTIYSLGFIISK